MIRASCPKCQKEIKVKNALAGKVVTCGRCKTSVKIPVSDGEDHWDDRDDEQGLVQDKSAEEFEVVPIEPCPHCQFSLIVEKHELRKNVECPNCKQFYVAKATGAGESPQSKPAIKPRKRVEDAVAIGDEVEEDVEDESEKNLSQRAKRKLERRQRVMKKVIPPVIALVVLGAMGFLVGAALGLKLAMQAKEALDQFKVPVPMSRGGCMFWMFQFAWWIVPLVTAYDVYHLREYRKCFTFAILCMLPCNAVFILGIPIGIWLMIVLYDEEVKREFD